MKTSFRGLLAIALIVFLNQAVYAQSEVESKNFIGLNAGVNFTQLHSSGDVFDGANFGSGYALGLSYNVFPDFGYSHMYIRVGGAYSRENSETPLAITIGDNTFRSRAELQLVEAHILFAYRFAVEAKYDVYLGGGLTVQHIINSADEAFTFETPEGDVIPMFDKDNDSLPMRFKNDIESVFVGPMAELGVFTPLGNRTFGLATGLCYSFLLTNNTGELKFSKANAYLRATYELF